MSQANGGVTDLIATKELNCSWRFPRKVRSRSMKLYRIFGRSHVGRDEGWLSIPVGNHDSVEAMEFPSNPRTDTSIDDALSCHIPDVFPRSGVRENDIMHFDARNVGPLKRAVRAAQS